MKSKILTFEIVRINLNFIHVRNTALRGAVYQIMRAKHLKFDYDVWLPTRKMNLQRGLEWSKTEKEDCVMSLLKGMGIGTFHFLIVENEDGTETVQVIDGKQRLNAIFDFYQNKFTINVEGEEYLYDNLDLRLQMTIKNFVPIGDLAYSTNDRVITDDEKCRWFVFVNSKGKPVDKEHIEKLQLFVK